MTGANGHLGRAIVGRLGAGGASIVELSSSPTGAQRRFRLGEPVTAGTLEDVDVVVHVAWDQTARDPRQAEEVNVAGSRRLVEAAERAGARMVFISSLAAYPGTRSLYGAGKSEVERAVAAAAGVSVRPGLIFGPSVGGMFGALRDQVSRHPVVPVIHSPGLLQLVHIADLAAIVVELSLTPDGDPTTVEVAHPASHSLAAVVKAIARALDRRIVTVPVPWRIVHGALRAAERAGLSLPFGSDSVVSLARSPEARIAPDVAARCRPFDEHTLSQP